MESELIDIKGAIDNPYRRIEARYDYTNAPCRCPNCGAYDGGFPWHGWFYCEKTCGCIAIVATGEALVPAQRRKLSV